ncbi:MAG: DUF4198 domain-containing protein [Desulfobulbaceae bacterium]|nr:DUF4198 domain-containing protein [Desulfobulbaceae bacterium]
MKHQANWRLWLGGVTFFILYSLIPVASHGHSLYIQSSRYLVHEGKQSPLFFCYGHHFPVDDGVRAKKLKSVRVYTPAGEIREVAIRNETSLHSYMVKYDAPGTYVLAAETNPGYYTVYIDKKGRERQTIKPKNAVIDKAKEIKKSLYSKQYAKTYVVCQTASENFPARIGLPLELVPTGDISALKPGEELKLKVYYNDKPYTGQGTWDATYSGFSTESEDNFYPKTAVSGDTVKIHIPKPGRWFVRYFIKINATGKDLEKYTHMKHTATLVFQISNERKTPEAKSN